MGLAIWTGQRRLDRERFEADDLVGSCRGERLIALRAVDDDRVDLRPHELNDLLQLILLAKQVPQESPAPTLWRFERDALECSVRIALADENVVAWMEEIF